MSKASRSYWDAARTFAGTPDWPTVATPAAASFFYESECQGESCDSLQATFLAMHLCRRYCPDCALQNLLDLTEAAVQFPDVPHYMLAHLPWNSYRVYPPTSITDKSRFYLKSDIERLDRRIKLMKATRLQTTPDLRHELAVFQRERQTATKKLDKWYAAFKRRKQTKINERWTIVSDAMRSRWGWQPVPYEELGPRLSKIVDHLFEVPVLSEAEWLYVEGDIKWAIRAEAKLRNKTDAPRQFSVRIKSKLPS
ncbi:hypothetical protein FRB90_006972 [Tulasnella sp. 427]|nr:hypothetical protein FRB90_006972 [Tulasnella sp. 427]